MNRELKWIDAKEPAPFSLNIKELRGSSANEELHMPFIRQSLQNPICMHGTIQISNIPGIFLPPPIHGSTPACIIINLPQSSSDLETDQGDIKDESFKVAR